MDKVSFDEGQPKTYDDQSRPDEDELRRSESKPKSGERPAERSGGTMISGKKPIERECVDSELLLLSVLFRLCASLFRFPLSPEVYHSLLEIDEDADDPVYRWEGCKQSLIRMSEACSHGDEEEVLHTTSAAFHTMFVGPHHLPCPPWGSVYMDGGRLFGPSTQEVRALFKKYGFSVAGGSREPSDHIAYELAFISELNKMMIDEGQGSRVSLGNEIKTFADRSITPWFSVFAEKVHESDPTGFYCALVDLVAALLYEEDRLLTCMR